MGLVEAWGGNAFGWFFANLIEAFYNLGYAILHPGQWLAWLPFINAPMSDVAVKESLMRFIYYGASDTRTYVAATTLDRLIDYALHTPSDAGRSAACVARRNDLIAADFRLALFAAAGMLADDLVAAGIDLDQGRLVGRRGSGSCAGLAPRGVASDPGLDLRVPVAVVVAGHRSYGTPAAEDLRANGSPRASIVLNPPAGTCQWKPSFMNTAG